MRKLLPIGSVVLLTGGTKEVMITGYKSKASSDGEVMDYNGCIFPEGFMENKFLLFNHSQIKEILFTGYEDEEYKKYLDKINQMLGVSYGKLNSSTDKSENNKKRKRTPKAPTKPMSASEMRSRYTSQSISGGQSEVFDMSKLKGGN